MSESSDISRLDKSLSDLSEHFDSVMIFATRHEPEIEDGTISAAKGVGNWYARYGQVKEWTIKAERDMRNQVEP